ncbi:DnaB-like helicase N-terminal domain-containing protein [Rhodococcus electrodiphilus]|uniref:DnaB-like helicase N-terminal domain-containing protein n=1 Tax=Rhodococcus ruber TaxID=1830 RepID=UPI0026F44731|nr:DnaB-like helicase N-terminal domain-containing protein [Rhodococcus ruber]MDO2377445.1 DnaB-like helicase N-terminal domain-containing protein [Rhodococcus ruber]
MPPITTEAPALLRPTLPETQVVPQSEVQSTASSRAVQPAGYADGTAAQAFLCAAMFSTPTGVAEVLAFVVDEDFEKPAQRRIVEALRALASAGHSTDAVSVGDWLTRHGRINADVQHELTCAITAGSNTAALRTYAACVVAEAFREEYASLGEALLESAGVMPEHDLMPQLIEGGTRMRAHHRRLDALRGTHN